MDLKCKLDVVIVTYNRLEKLKKCLSLYESQTSLIRTLIVVNNNSSDDTYGYLNEWAEDDHPFNVIIKHLDSNIGGSGGFYHGQKIAEELNADWVLLADDDAYPANDLIERFYKILDNIDNSVSAVCTQVQNVDTSIDLSHRRLQSFRRGRIVRTNVSASLYEHKSFELDLLSYVGAFIRVDSIRRVGFVNPAFFIYEDDGEHSLRLRKIGKILCFPELIYVHDSGQNNDVKNQNIIISWRDYYALRNYLYVCIHYHLISALRLTMANLFKILVRKGPIEMKKMMWTAIKDAWFNNLGVHLKYKPGWQILN